MAIKRDPHDMVALMSYLFPTKQASSSGSIDPLSFNAQHCIGNNGQTRVCTFTILDPLRVYVHLRGDFRL